MNLIICLIVGAVCGVIGMAVGDLGTKKNGKLGFLLGFLLGPIGIIITAVLPAGSGTTQGMRPQTWVLLGIAVAVAVAMVALYFYAVRN